MIAQQVTLPTTKFFNVYQFDNMAFNIATIDLIRAEGGTETKQTNVQAYMTNWKLAIPENELPYTDFFTFLNVSLVDAWSRVAGNTPGPIQYSIFDMWGAIYNQGDFSKVHKHSQAQLSFVYYLQAIGDDIAPLLFNDIEYELTPNTGMLVIFPGWLNHCVPPSTGQHERIVLAGNIHIPDLAY
jgi:hypothetical protein